jgi:hypothetical protein
MHFAHSLHILQALFFVTPYVRVCAGRNRAWVNGEGGKPFDALKSVSRFR